MPWGFKAYSLETPNTIRAQYSRVQIFVEQISATGRTKTVIFAEFFLIFFFFFSFKNMKNMCEREWAVPRYFLEYCFGKRHNLIFVVLVPKKI